MTTRTPVCERCSRPIESEDDREQPGAGLWEHVGGCPPWHAGNDDCQCPTHSKAGAE